MLKLVSQKLCYFFLYRKPLTFCLKPENLYLFIYPRIVWVCPRKKEIFTESYGPFIFEELEYNQMYSTHSLTELSFLLLIPMSRISEGHLWFWFDRIHLMGGLWKRTFLVVESWANLLLRVCLEILAPRRRAGGEAGLGPWSIPSPPSLTACAFPGHVWDRSLPQQLWLRL